MNRIKHVAAGLVALAMLTTSAMAHQVPAAGSYAFMKGHAAAGHWSGGPRMAEQRFGETEALPQDQPGGLRPRRQPDDLLSWIVHGGDLRRNLR